MIILLVVGVLAFFGLMIKKISMNQLHDHIIHVSRESIEHTQEVKHTFRGCVTCSNTVGNFISVLFFGALIIVPPIIYFLVPTKIK